MLPKLTGCRYERIEEMKEAVTKVIDTLTHEDSPGAFQKLFERYKYMRVLSIKVPIRKKSGNLLNEPRTLSSKLDW